MEGLFKDGSKVAADGFTMNRKTAINPQRAENYPDWYQEVIKSAELAEMSSIRGCMIIRQWGYGIWQEVQRLLDTRIRDTGHDNVYFPLFIPLSYIEKEAAHVEGFAKEMAVVTHHRLEKKDGRLQPSAPLTEPLIVRPTSETVIGAAMAKWITSYRDLPLLLNQWANVVRWEMRPRIFLRTTEFLWQEGHTAHATRDEALRETRQMLEVYRSFLRDELAIPVFCGEKPPSERFPGAETTLSVEAMMQDGKALQAGTSHYLGKNFAKAANICFTDDNGEQQYVHTTSWGMTSRVIGALIMVHGDDDGLCVPPRIAPRHIIIVPAKVNDSELSAYCDQLATKLRQEKFANRSIVVQVDNRDRRLGEKNWYWIKKGVPLIVNIGNRERQSQTVSIIRRDGDVQRRQSLAVSEFVAQSGSLLAEIQDNYLERAQKFLAEHTNNEVRTFDEFQKVFVGDLFPQPFVVAKWCENHQCQQQAEKLAVTIRCVPVEQSCSAGNCVICAKEATTDVVFAKSY